MSEMKTIQEQWWTYEPWQMGWGLVGYGRRGLEGEHAVLICDTADRALQGKDESDADFDARQKINARKITAIPTMLSALKAADASMTLAWTDPSHADARRELGTEMCEIWTQIRSAISQADGR